MRILVYRNLNIVIKIFAYTALDLLVDLRRERSGILEIFCRMPVRY